MSDESKHVADEVLFDYADDVLSPSDRRAVEAHLAGCESCRDAAEQFRTVTEALSNEETWWVADKVISGEGARAIQELLDRWEAEDTEAARMLEPVLESPYRFAYANILRRKRFYTGGVVRLLCEQSYVECVRAPKFAFTLSQTAAYIADALPDNFYPGSAVNQLRGTAWKELSTVCRYLGEFDTGFDALDRAGRAYRKLPDPEIHLAVVDLCRAALLFEQQRYDEALPLARSVGDVFSARRDIERYVQAKEWEAQILHRQGDVTVARTTYQAVFDLADTIGDPEMKARAANNLSVAYSDEGNITSATHFLLIALQLYEALDQRAMIIHTRWSIARLALSSGNAVEAARRLPFLIDELEQLGMMTDAARAQLDLAEAFVLLERYDEVESVCMSLVAFFRRASMLTGALTAAAFLKEAAAARRITPRHIEQVRKYLFELKRSPHLAFVPSPEQD